MGKLTNGVPMPPAPSQSPCTAPTRRELPVNKFRLACCRIENDNHPLYWLFEQSWTVSGRFHGSMSRHTA